MSVSDIAILVKKYLNCTPETLSSQELTLFQNFIKQLQKAYYQDNNSLIDDSTFDKLYKLLQSAEKTLKSNDTVLTATIGSDLTSKQITRVHHEVMLSLENAFNQDDLIDFDNRILKILEKRTFSYLIEPKIDGLSISLVYENDQLIDAVTRGNGKEGESVFAQVCEIKNLPQTLPLHQKGIRKCEIKGEIYISKKDFSQINTELIAKGKSPFTSSRNLASGGVRLKNTEAVRERKLSIMLYKLVIVEGNYQTHSQMESLNFFHELGLNTTLPYVKLAKSIEEVIPICDSLEKDRNTLPFDIDGLVVKVNEIPIQEQIGQTSHHPKWAIALKLKAQSKKSKLLNVTFQVSRNGTITPVAKVEPVSIAGAVITSVSLFNEEFINEKKLAIGDTVLIERSGDVIPYIAGVLYQERTGNEKRVLFPKNCPSCEQPLQKEDSQWRCYNRECEEQIILSIIHFTSKGALDIEGLGEQIIRRFVDEKLIKSIVDIFRLPFDTIKQYDGFGEKSATNLTQAIEIAKHRPMAAVLYGLGIRHVGKNMAQKLCDEIQDIRDLANFSLEQLQSLPDIGPKVAQSVIDFFNKPQNIKMLNELAHNGLALNIQKSNPNVSNKLNGASFLFTGTLYKIKRNQAEQLVKTNGGIVLNSVSKKLNNLVVGENPGSKLSKAQKVKNVTILEEDAFLTLLETLNINVS